MNTILPGLLPFFALLFLSACGADSDGFEPWEFDEDSELGDALEVQACSSIGGYDRIASWGPIGDDKCLHLYLSSPDMGLSPFLDVDELIIDNESWALHRALLYDSSCLAPARTLHALDAIDGELQIDFEQPLSLSFDLNVHYRDQSELASFHWRANDIDASRSCSEFAQ